MSTITPYSSQTYSPQTYSRIPGIISQSFLSINRSQMVTATVILVLANLHGADAGPAAFAACMATCLAITCGAFAPACAAACAAALVAPSP